MTGVQGPNGFSMGAGVPPPQQESNRSMGQGRKDRTGQSFPALPLVRTGLPFRHGQHLIEEQNTLLRPSGQVSMHRGRPPHIGLNLTVHVSQGRRNGLSPSD